MSKYSEGNQKGVKIELRGLNNISKGWFKEYSLKILHLQISTRLKGECLFVNKGRSKFMSNW